MGLWERPFIPPYARWGERIANLSDEDKKRGFRSIYSSDLGDDIVEDFLIPAIEGAVEYERVTGDFSAAFLVAAARGLGPFFLNNGRMKLVTNGRFSENDAKAIEAGTSPNVVLEGVIVRELNLLNDIVTEFERDHLKALVWLLKTGRLDIRVSLLRDANGRPLPASSPIGTQHSKVGIIHWAAGEKIVFIGGLNESMRAYMGNAESLQASYSWNSDDSREIQIIESIFDAIWDDRSPKSTTMKFPDACKEKLIAIYEMAQPPDLSKWSANQSIRRSDVGKWGHQIEAMKAFLEARNGILEMATGTGKTRIALMIAEKLLENGEIDGMIVATRGNDLLDQWYRELLTYFGSSRLLILRHYGPLKEMDTFLEVVSIKHAALLTSYQNLAELLLKGKNDRLKTCLLICDEVHNIGSAGNVRALRGKLTQIPWRLGLSATSEREYDKEGNDFIDNEIGGVLKTFGLENAIEMGILCEIDYVPLFYEFNQEDKERLRGVYALYSARKNTSDPMSVEELYLELAKVRKLSKSKLPVFRKYLEEDREVLRRCLIFVETKEYGELVQEIVIPFNADYHTYYGEDESQNLRRFSKGDLDSLITCKRISEGIDIRSVSNIVLFSSSRARLETIQRIGRALRISPEIPDKRAKVVDFIRRSDFSAKETASFEPVDKKRHDWLMELSKVRRKR